MRHEHRAFVMAVASRTIVVALIVALALPLRGSALAFVWEGLAGDGSDWHDALNWDPQYVPGAGAEVTVAAGATLVLTNETAELASFAMNGGTMTFSNWYSRLRAVDVNLQGGTLTLPAAFSMNQMSNRVWIACSNLTLAAGASIDVDGLGYAGSQGPGKTADRGTSGPSAGAGHGGRGGLTTQLIIGGPVYGSSPQPQTPGSGSGSTSHYSGRPGGGVVRIEATGHVQVDGTLSANGVAGVQGFSDRHVGGAAGGSVWIACETFGSSGGSLRADGGAGYATAAQSSGGGGGGRIAVVYDTVAQASVTPSPTARFSVEPGRGGAFHPLESTARILSDGSAYLDRTRTADWGSLYVSDDSGVVGIAETVVDLAGYLTFGNDATNFTVNALRLEKTYLGFGTNVVLIVEGALETDADSGLMTKHPLRLSVGGTSVFRGECRLNAPIHFTCEGGVTAEQNASVFLGAGSVLGIDGGLKIAGAVANLVLKGAEVTVTGDVEIVSGAWLAVMGDGEDGTIGDAAMRLTTEDDIKIGEESALYVYSDPVAGGSPAFICRNLVLAETGGINGDGRGYAGSQGPGKSADGSITPSAGAGHGGRGGLDSRRKLGGSIYGSIAQPRSPGSGSGRTTSAAGRSGGGVVRVVATDHVQVDGAISANGSDGVQVFGDRNVGGGAGGSIWLISETLGGGGWIRASGGDGYSSGSESSGGGGGGRIAVAYDTVAQAAQSPAPTIRFTVNPGRGGAFRPTTAPALPMPGNLRYYDHSYGADWGSLFFSDDSGVAAIDETDLRLSGYVSFGHNATNFTLNALSLANAHLGFDTGAVLNITGALATDADSGLIARHPLQLNVGGHAVLRGESFLGSAVTVSVAGELTVEEAASVYLAPGSTLDVGGGLTVTGGISEVMLRGVDATIGGNLRVLDGAWLSAMGYGAGLAAESAMGLRVEGDIAVEAGSWIYAFADPQLGGSPFFHCRNLSVATDAGFQGDGRGYAMAGPGMGGGGTSTGHRGAGGGHGGRGGDSSTHAGGKTNDHPHLPLLAGSSGGRSLAAYAGPGGAAIHLRVRQRAQIDGTLTANGGAAVHDGNNRYTGGGAGGSILLVAGDLGGSDARLSADGGIGNLTYGGGGGGGGRIAVYSGISDSRYDRIVAGDVRGIVSNSVIPGLGGSWSVEGGTGYKDGEDGSAWFFAGPPQGTLILIR